MENFKRKAKGSEFNKGPLSVDEVDNAERHLVRCVQKVSYPEEYAALEGENFVEKHSSLRGLNPFLDQYGVMRHNGRIQNAHFLPLKVKQPIILPPKHTLSRLIADWYHRKLHHLNSATVINEIRQTFWIPSLRSLVRNVEVNCAFCRLRKAKPIQPQMGQLPKDLVTPYVRPFSYTGLDYFEPISVTIRRQREKRWIALFTCLSVRAVHLEIASDLSSDACLLCIRNFVNRRGVPI